MSNTSELQRALYQLWSREFRTGTITERMSSQFVTHMSSLVTRAMSEEMQRIARVIDIVPANVDIVIDSRNCLRALRRIGIFTEDELTSTGCGASDGSVHIGTWARPDPCEEYPRGN